MEEILIASGKKPSEINEKLIKKLREKILVQKKNQINEQNAN